MQELAVGAMLGAVRQNRKVLLRRLIFLTMEQRTIENCLNKGQDAIQAVERQSRSVQKMLIEQMKSEENTRKIALLNATMVNCKNLEDVVGPAVDHDLEQCLKIKKAKADAKAMLDVEAFKESALLEYLEELQVIDDGGVKIEYPVGPNLVFSIIPEH